MTITDIVAFPVKTPTEVKDYSFDWTDELSGDTIATSSWAVTPAGLTIDSDSKTTLVATVTVSAGIVGGHYTLTNTVVTAGNRTLTKSGVVKLVAHK